MRFPPSFPQPIRRLQTRAFSLVELLVVISVLAILMSASIPALLSSQRASALTQAGNAIVDLTNLARETAQSKNTITALILVTKTSVQIQQAVAVLEYDAMGENWKTATGWIRLPLNAAVVDFGGDAIPDANQKALALDAPAYILKSLKVDGKSVYDLLGQTPRIVASPDASNNSASAIIFYPDGRMQNGTAAIRQLSTRFVTDKLDDKQSSTLPNYYDVVVNGNTSAVRVVRP